jgi:hypothetical protein
LSNRGASPGAERSLPLWLLLVFAVAVVSSASLSPPIYLALRNGGLAGFAFRRLLRRIAELAAAATLGIAWRRLGVRRLVDLGLRDGPRVRGDAWRSALVAGGSTALLMSVEFALGHRVASGAPGVAVLLRSALTALAVGLVAQSVCSGGLLFPFGPPRGGRLLAAAVTVAAFFATAHCLRGGRDPAVVDWAAGWRMWADVPRGIWLYRESWTGLFALGLLLYLWAARQGHAWGAIGAHVAAVAVLQTVGAVSDVAPGARQWFFLEGLLPGYGAAAVLLPAIAWLMIDCLHGPTAAGAETGGEPHAAGG